jgi:transcriptional repressor NrdR
MVEERSGNSEKFDEEKLVSGISRAGTPFLLAKDISKSITSKLAQNPPLDNFIYSSKIREYITEELKQRNHDSIAESFSGYSKNNVIPY